MRDARPDCPWRAGACRAPRPLIHLFSGPLSQPATRAHVRERPQPIPNSNDAKHLRPHGDHAEKQGDRRQCQSLLGDSANHCSAPLLERIGNIVHTLFAESRAVGQFEMWRSIRRLRRRRQVAVWRGGIAPEYAGRGRNGKPCPFCLFVHRWKDRRIFEAGEPTAAISRKPSSGEMGGRLSPQAPRR